MTIMHEIEWRKDGEQPCLFSLAFAVAGIVTNVLVAYVMVHYGAPVILDLWWS